MLDHFFVVFSVIENLGGQRFPERCFYKGISTLFSTKVPIPGI